MLTDALTAAPPLPGATDPRLRLFLAVGGSLGIALALNLVTSAVLARLLGTSAFGEWSLIVAAASLLATAAGTWTQASVVRFGVEEWLQSGTLARTFAARVPMLAASAAAVGVLIAVDPGGWLARGFGIPPRLGWLVALYTAGAWLMLEVQAVLRATERLRVYARLAPLARLLALAAVVPLMFAVATPSLTSVALAVTVPPALLWGVAWLRALARARVRLLWPAAGDVRAHLRYSWPLLPTALIGYVSDWGDHVLLRALASSHDVGLFGLGYQVFAGMLAANGVFTTVLLPQLIAEQRSTTAAMAIYLRDVAPTILTFWMVASVWLVAAVPAVILLLGGDAFADAVPVVTVLVVAVPASVITHLYGVLYDLQHRLHVGMRFSLMMSVVNVAASLALIPALGARGAAAATAASYVLMQWWYVRDQHRLAGQSAVTIQALWTVALCAGLLQVLVPGRPFLRVLWGIAATATIILVARRLRAVDPGVTRRILSGPFARVAGAVTYLTVAPRR